MKQIVFIGGGTGISSVLKEYRSFANSGYLITAVICMFDRGGSTGMLREEFKMLPIGDIRQVMLSLAPDSMMKRLFSYRFSPKESIKSHNLGNLIITALKDIEGDEKAAFAVCRQLLGVESRIWPITWESSDIAATYENGETIESEHVIDDMYQDKESKGRIVDFMLKPKVFIAPEAANAIASADCIVIGPGDLYLSIICNFLVDGFADALNMFSGQILYIPNLVNKIGQTEGFSLQDYVDTVNRYLKTKKISKVLVNSSKIPQEALNSYKAMDSYPPVNNLAKETTIMADLISDEKVYKDPSDTLFRGYIRHDSTKVLSTIFDYLDHQSS